VNDSASPITTPSGRRRPPVTPAESASGSTGSTQGDTAVAAPATNANTMSNTTYCSVAERQIATGTESHRQYDSASTTSGSNCVPACSLSSLSAVSTSTASRWGQLFVITP
jgi:hypothetical protein